MTKYFLICENIMQKNLAKLQKSDHNQIDV